VVTVSLLAALSAVAPGQPAGRDNKDLKAVVQGNSVFALDLYSRLRAREGNLFLSPYSISTALAMAYGGARGETAEEMARTMHFGPEPPRLHAAFAGLQGEIQGDAAKHKYKLTVANRLWGQKGYHFLPEYLKSSRLHYGAELAEVDFQNATEGTRKTINGWVEEKTNDKIKDLLQRGMLTPLTRLVLTNAIYFKASWASAFQEVATKKEFFMVAAAEKELVPMMHQTETCPFFEGETFQMVSLPYEQNDLSMVVLLPKKVDGLPELEKSLTSARLDGWLAKMTTHQVDLSLPKFRTTSDFDLGKTLADMGMPLAFNAKKADFSGLTTEEKLFISRVIHKAYVDVNENGTEAAAATAVIVKESAPPPRYPAATFRADHPFVFLLRDTRTGSILFMGRVVNPAG
jgi:serpin B